MDSESVLNGAVLTSPKPANGDGEPDAKQQQQPLTQTAQPEETAADPEQSEGTIDVYKSEPPDGGRAAWLALLSSWCMLFCTFGMINCIGTFQGYYQEVYLRAYSPGTVSWIPSLQIFIAYVTNPFTGRLYDVYGPRALVAVGTVLEVLGLVATSLSTRYYQILLAQGLCTSLGMSALYVPATALVAGWFGRRRRGLAYGLATSGSSLGGIVLPLLIARLIPRVGFPWTLRAVALLVLALLLVANALVRSRLPPSPAPLSSRILLGPLRDVKLMLVNGGFLLMTLGVFVPINYVAVEARRQHGLPDALGHYLVATMNAGSLVGRVGAGVVADTVGAYNTFVAVSALAGVLVLALYIPAASAGAVWTFVVLFGCTSGAYIALLAPLVVKISPLEEAGYRIGLLFAMSSVSGLVTSPIGGAILERWHGDYTGMKIYSGVMMLSGAALVFVSRMMATEWKMNAVF
ncbi:Major facilitator superfamily domain, general substrate transporter [Beauveria brongniartii RCEF 3172]|uniref:Major facilitator superfamily domain, general substrate transporter n=1 Tax=Beauveria brongniartii RCEF 3172 TaxID=1081107 RepID=A0A167JDN4_9HYPO|nr:Major facilitator superfamily domain, general substrate transporter [Beauveria brongniartii RCEF 3172]